MRARRAPSYAAAAGRPAGRLSAPSGPRCPLPAHSPAAPPRRLPRGRPRTCCSHCTGDWGKSCDRVAAAARLPTAAGPPVPVLRAQPGPPPPSKMATALTRRRAPARWAGPDAAPRRTPAGLPGCSGCAALMHFLFSFKGRGPRLASHPSAECFLGIVVSNGTLSPGPSLPILLPSVSHPQSRCIFFLALRIAATRTFFWVLRSSVLPPATSFSLLCFTCLDIFIFHTVILHQSLPQTFPEPLHGSDPPVKILSCLCIVTQQHTVS